jgi:Carboxypeptidase regulatory-like domain
MQTSTTMTGRNQTFHNTKRFFARYLCLLTVLMFASVASICAQKTTGSIVGTVKDQTGALVSAAKVKATNVDTGFSRLSPTNGSGMYRIDYLPVGNYIVAVEAPSFQRFVQENLTLSVDQTLTLDVAMTVGVQSETVTVTTAPPMVNTSDAVLGRTIGLEEIVGLPLVNRNVYAELSLTPGVMSNSNSPTANPSGTPNMTVGLPSAAVQVNGSLDSGNGTVAFYLDGGNNITGMRNYGNPAPNPAALEEFRVETNAFSAEYGQFSGAVVTVITKSGNNKFHGELFEFDRNTAFNAFSWIPAKDPVTKAPIKLPYHRNNFGGAFGGPIKHDKAFFFFSYAGLRQTQGAPVSGAFTPTAAERAGDFTAHTPDPITNPTGFSVYFPQPLTTTAALWRVPANVIHGTNSSPGCLTDKPNCIPTALLDPTAANFLNVNNKIGVSVPLPTGPAQASGGAAYIGEYTTPTNSDEYLGKYDENVGNADHVTATYFFVKTKSTPSGGGNINWTGNQSAAAQTNVTLADVHTFSGSTANQTWLTFTRAMGGRALIPVTGPANQTLASFQTTNTTNPFVIDGPAGLPYLNLGSGAFQTGNPNAGPVTGSDNYELRDVVSLTKGKHSLAIGGEFALDKTMFLANLNNYGDVNFTNSAPTSTGNVFSDFVTGQTASFEQDSHYVTHLSTWHIAAFAQDNYRITSRFTANLGLRWDIDTPPVDGHNRTASFVPGQQSTVTPAAPLGQVFVGDSGIGRGITSTSFTHISPRVGFALDPFGDGKTSIRAAAGIFFGIPSGNEWNQPGNAMPFSIRNNFGNTPSLTNLYGGPNYNFPTTASGGGIFPYTYTPSAPKFYPSQSIEAINPNVKYSSVYQFNFSVQRQLPYNLTVSAAYVGTLGRHLQTFVDANYAPYATVDYLKNPLTPSTSGLNTDLRRQYDAGPGGTAGTLTGITELISDQTSNYNGLQISATKQMSRGFSVSGFYVWSRALESSNPVENGLMSAQDFGVLGKPFTAFNNKYGAIGGGLQEEYGLMDQNRNSNAAISGMWNINYFHGSNKIVQGVVNGWTISPVVYLMSGTPFTVNTGSNKNFDSQGSSRPNVNPGGPSPKLDPHRCRVCGATGQSPTSVVTQWFNGTDYLKNPTGASYLANGPGVAGGIGPGGADGNVGRDTLVGPGLKDMDAALLRDIAFERGVAFQFRVEVTNVMNWVSLNNPSSGSISSTSQGTISSAAGTQRVIQLGGRLTF